LFPAAPDGVNDLVPPTRSLAGDLGEEMKRDHREAGRTEKISDLSLPASL
jgi:hypothetical protein